MGREGRELVRYRFLLTRHLREWLPLLMIVKGKPNPMAKRFLDYMLAEGQKDVAGQGYVPVNQVQ